MKDLNVDLDIRVCVSEADYDQCYEYIKGVADYLICKVVENYNCTAEKYLD